MLFDPDLTKIRERFGRLGVFKLLWMVIRLKFIPKSKFEIQYPLTALPLLMKEGGKVAWAFVIKANRQVFEPGPEDVYGSLVLISPGTPDLECLQHLPAVCNRIKKYYGHDQPDWTAETIANFQLIRDDYAPFGWMPVSSQLSPFIRCLVSTCWIPRTSLPGGKLDGGFFPVALHEDENGYTCLALPLKYWNKRLIKNWKKASAQFKEAHFPSQSGVTEHLEEDAAGEEQPTYTITVEGVPLPYLDPLEAELWEVFPKNGLTLSLVDIGSFGEADEGECTIIGPIEELKAAKATLRSVVRLLVPETSWKKIEVRIQEAGMNPDEDEDATEPL